jgi:hypothetical protein
MGADRGVRESLAKVSNIVWFRLVKARPVAAQTGRPGDREDSADDELAIAVLTPASLRHSTDNRASDGSDH